MIMEDEYYCTGDETEIREYHRKIDFGENAVKEKYNVLIPEYQEIVYRVLRELADGREYFGYNFSRFLKSYKKAEPSVSQLRISRLLLKILGDGVSTSEKEVNNRLDIAKKNDSYKKISRRSDFTNRRFCQGHMQLFFNRYGFVGKGNRKSGLYKRRMGLQI